MYHIMNHAFFSKIWTLVYAIMFLWLQMGQNLYTHVKLVDKFIYSRFEIQKMLRWPHVATYVVKSGSFWNHEVVTILKYFGFNCTCRVSKP